MARVATGGRRAGQGSKWIRPEKRQCIYLRDGLACVYCGSGLADGAILTLDHVLACELGGTNDPSNLVTACMSCNSAKGALSKREWFASLRDRGIDTASLAAKIRRHTARSWRTYLDRVRAIATDAD